MTNTQFRFSRADKALPELPKFSIESRRPRTAATDDSCPSPTVRVYEGARTTSYSPRNLRVPQFRQSRRWAQKYDPANSSQIPEKDLVQPAPDTEEAEERILTLREESFEQQRAVLKHVTSRLSGFDEAERRRNEGRDDNAVSETGLCQSGTIQCWKTVKATIFITSHPSLRNHDERPASRRTGPPRKRDRRVRRGSERVALPRFARMGSTFMQRKPVPPPKQTAPQLNPVKPTGYGTYHREFDGERSPGPPRSSSPVPSLHDPEKDSRFSKECMEILNSLDFNRDWLIPPAQGFSRSPHPPSKPIPATSRSVLHPRKVDGNDTISIEAALASIPAPLSAEGPSLVPNIMVTTSTPATETKRPVPPERSSSKQEVDGSAPLISRSNSQSLLQTPTPKLASGSRLNGPRPAVSIDTLAKIEAQVKSDTDPFTTDDYKLRVSHASTESKSGGPPSIPPERPLPALPAGVVQDTFRRSVDSARVPTGHFADSNESLSMSTIRIVSSIPDQPDEQLPRSKRPTTPARQNNDERSPHPSERRSSDLMSVDSRSSRSRESLRSTRAERVKERRKRDLRQSVSDRKGQEKPKNITTHDQSSAHTQSEQHYQPNILNSQPSIDELDRFPSVPEMRSDAGMHSRTGSRKHNRDHSQVSQMSHNRQMSKASTLQSRAGRPREVLSRSNIFVVVDSDPVTARFRAGAMSPAPSISGSPSRSASPYHAMKHARRLSNLKEASSNQGSPLKSLTKNISMQSLQQMRSTASIRSNSIASRATKRHARASSRHMSSSSDESQLVLVTTSSNSPQKRSNKPHKRRRWNSNDLVDVGTLKNTVEELFVVVVKQEEKIRWQADQIQMMIRVMAPMNRVRGIRVPSGLADIQDYSTGDEQVVDDHRSLAKRSNSVLKGGGGKLEPQSNKTGLMTPTPHTKKNEKSRPTHGHTRTHSAGNCSTVSNSASAHTTDAAKVSADDASMTDPLDYDLGNPGPTTTFQGSKPSTVATDPSRIHIAPLNLKTTTAAATATGGHHVARPMSREKLNPRAGASNSSIVPLHHPPPVASIIPRGKLPEEMSLLSRSTSLAERTTHHQPPPPLPSSPSATTNIPNQGQSSRRSESRRRFAPYSHSQTQTQIQAQVQSQPRRIFLRLDESSDDDDDEPQTHAQASASNSHGMMPFDSEAENRRDAARLSVNHVLTSTEQMDRAIEQFMYLG